MGFNWAFKVLIVYGISYMFRHYIAIRRDVVRGDLRSPHTTPLDTARPSTIIYRLLLN
jgi:hypothetical protein